ncbi:DNA topology modulation protein FlaR [Vibrio vulnificus]|uniref:DNA topology modulation protein FlaR n=1 Tax=Gammaproteobacteria TaxID=1236 RepID=UPI000E6716B9|nr:MULTISPECIES: DNA topology modulation protein FlaR [Gammaproteobacteria]EKA5638242.1 DNA topology modulation protein FlaR [Vibrio navarrensis]MCG6264853.1 DNA topology modulation protein FlaR [Vibrio vulnificus]
MQYHKIHIIGGPGSGKTYSAKKLQQATNLTAFDLDEVFWDQSQNSYIRASEELRTEKLNIILECDNWIIEGVYYKWLDRSFQNADVIIILNPPLIKRQWRILKRFLVRKFFLGDFRKETFSSFIELWRWNSKFDVDNMVRITNFTSKYKNKIVYCSSYDEIKRIINA